jgi:hypothetical protein
VQLVEIEKTVAEGAGAAGLAALLQHPARFAGRRVGIPICGGNIDARLLADVLMRGLVRDGRMVRLLVTMPDIAGALAKVAAMIGDGGGQYRRSPASAGVRHDLGQGAGRRVRHRDARPPAHRGRAFAARIPRRPGEHYRGAETVEFAASS